MAVVEGVVDPVDLALEHADTIIQLIDDSKFLVACSISGDGKGSVVGAHLGDIAVFPVAKLGVVVARSSIAHSRSTACACGGHCAVRAAHELGQLICVGGTGDLGV